MKQYVMTALLLLLALAGWSADQTVVLTTSRGVGETLTLHVTAISPVRVDWGDGNVMAYSTEEISGEVKGETITVSGDEMWTALDCSSCGLTSVTTKGAPQLKVLNCSNNALTSLSLSSNTGLQVLDCSDNQIKSLSLTSCKALRHLDCSNNVMTSVNVTSNKDLQALIANDNQIKTLNTTGNTLLQSLWVDRNQLTALTLTNDTSLVSVTANDNQLRRVNGESFPYLRDLWVERNLLNEIDLSETKGLYSVRCDSNNLSTLNMGALSASKKMYLVDCRDNRLPLSQMYAASVVDNYLIGRQIDADPGYDTVRAKVDPVNLLNLLKNRNGGRVGTFEFRSEKTNKPLVRGTEEEGADYMVLSTNARFFKGYRGVYAVITSTSYPGMEILTFPFVVLNEDGTLPDEEEGIRRIAAGNAGNAPLYNLQGQRVDQPVKGLYIQNGKKVVVK